MHASTIGEGTDRLVRKALIAGIGLDHQRVEDLAKSITTTESIGRVASHDNTEQLSNDQWIDLLNLTSGGASMFRHKQGEIVRGGEW